MVVLLIFAEISCKDTRLPRCPRKHYMSEIIFLLLLKPFICANLIFDTIRSANLQIFFKEFAAGTANIKSIDADFYLNCIKERDRISAHRPIVTLKIVVNVLSDII